LPLYTAHMHCSKHQSSGRTFEMHCMRSSNLFAISPSYQHQVNNQSGMPAGG